MPASTLADIGHLLESVEQPEQQIEGALTLLSGLVPYTRCALLCAASGAPSGLVLVPAGAWEKSEAVGERLTVLFQMLADRANARTSGLPIRDSIPDQTLALGHLAFPLIALDEPIGVVLVEKVGEYEERHLQLLAIVAAQLGAYLANVRLRAEEKRAARATERAADLLNRIRDGFVEIDSSLICVTVNPAAAELLGLPRAEIVGADIRTISDLGQNPAFLNAYERAWHERVRVGVEAQMLSARGVWVELELYPTELGVSMFLRDVTERRAAEAFRDLLTGIIGHDLRTPLSVITMGAATLLKRGNLDGPAVSSVARIARSGARMSEMVGYLLDLTRVRFGHGLPITREHVDLAVICQDVVDELKTTHIDREIYCDTAGDLHGEWDPARLSQVLSNLVANAVQYGDPAVPVRLSVNDNVEGGVTVEVHNAGPPIPAESLASIFQPFRQASSNRGNTIGLGLGLFIAHSIIRAHGGTIEVQSSQQAGTTFTVRLPRTH